MINYIRQKIKNQKWLSLSLVLGITLLIAIVVCQPLFQNGCQNKLMQRMLQEQLQKTNRYPAQIGVKGMRGGDLISSLAEVEEYVADRREEMMSFLPGVDIADEQICYSIINGYCEIYYADLWIATDISYMPGLMEHCDIVKESDCGVTTTGHAIPCYVSEATMDLKQLLPGERLYFEDIVNADKEPLEMYVAGVLREKDMQDLYWYETLEDLKLNVFVNREDLDKIIGEYDVRLVSYNSSELLDYTALRNEKTDDILRLKRYYDGLEITDYSSNMNELLEEFAEKRMLINVMLAVLELPIIGMMFAFLYMVSNQIVTAGRAQLGTLKSRGFRKKQIMKLYFGEYAVLSAISLLPGLPLGYGLCKLAAMTTDFCVFEGTDLGSYPFRAISVLYGVAAVIVALLFVMLPVIANSKMSIVEYKSTSHESKKMLWEKGFLDVILLGLSLYFLYNFNQSVEQLRTKALSGNKIDPFIFLNVCLFIVSAGFFIFRLMHGFVKLIYSIGRKHWKPVSYAAFLQILRTFRKQTFISVFIILTVAFGVFDANVARTINRNIEDRVQYEQGSDVRLQEKWLIKNYMDSGVIKYRYLEPDFGKYDNLVTDGYCDSVTRVLRMDNMSAQYRINSSSNLKVMGIDTKPFGETAFLKAELYGEDHWYNRLNELSTVANGVIISSNLAEDMDLTIGKDIWLLENKPNPRAMHCTIVDIVDAWPGFTRYEYSTGGHMSESYLAVVNIKPMIQSFAIRPYEVWLDKAEGVSDDEIYEYLSEDMGVKITAFTGKDTVNTDKKQAPDIQIVNGIFTLSFLIALSLCGVGFLIYWLISIKQRELLLGSYRAMGLSVGSINRMLIMEHIFSTFLSVISGGLVGVAATILFVPLFGIIYLPEKSVLDIYTYYELNDMLRLFLVVGVIIILCLSILRRQIKKMNITQALKLGED